jgi:type VI protein secretion system component Hcp
MKRISTVLGLAVALAIGTPAFAATNIIVNITGNNNSDVCNSTLIDKTSGFEISSYSVGGIGPVTTSSSGAAVAKPTISDLVISKPFSACSGELMKYFLTVHRFDTVTLYDKAHLSSNFPVEIEFTITLSNAVITSYEVTGTASSDPQELVSLNFTKICYDTRPRNSDAKGTPPVCYDRTTNTVH